MAWDALVPEILVAIANYLRDEHGLKVERSAHGYSIRMDKSPGPQPPFTAHVYNYRYVPCDSIILEIHSEILYVEKHGLDYDSWLFELTNPSELDRAINMILTYIRDSKLETTYV